MIFQKDFPQYISSSKYAATSSSSAALAEMILVDVPDSSSFSTKTTKRTPSTFPITALGLERFVFIGCPSRTGGRGSPIVCCLNSPSRKSLNPGVQQKKKWLRVYRTPSYKKPGRHFLTIKYHIRRRLSNCFYTRFDNLVI